MAIRRTNRHCHPQFPWDSVRTFTRRDRNGKRQNCREDPCLVMVLPQNNPTADTTIVCDGRRLNCREIRCHSHDEYMRRPSVELSLDTRRPRQQETMARQWDATAVGSIVAAHWVAQAFSDLPGQASRWPDKSMREKFGFDGEEEF